MISILLKRPALFAFWIVMGVALSLKPAQAQLSPQEQNAQQQLPGAIMQHLENPYTGRPLNKPVDQLPTQIQKSGQTPAIKNEILEPHLDDSLKRKLPIKQIKVEGYTKLSTEEVQAIVAPYQGQSVSFAELQEKVSDKLNALYEKKGFITALVYIPPQTIQEGIITIRVDEGRISKITLAENRWFKDRAILPRVDLKKGEIFNTIPLQKSLRRINENPDIVLQATLKAGQNTGETEVVLTPRAENFFVHLSPFIDNLGRPVIGSNRYGFTYINNNALGFGDSAFSSPYWTGKSFGIINGYELPLGSHGTKLGFSNAHTQYKMFSNGFKLNGSSNINTPYISQELYRSDKAVLTAELGLAIKNSNFNIEDSRISQTKLRVLTPAINLQTFDRWGRTYMRHELGFGLNMAGATDKNGTLASRPGTSGKFFRYTASASRLQLLPWGTYGIMKVQAQATPDRLFSLEQMQVGGSATVRGYREGRLIGDRGFVTSAEWRVPLRFIPAEMKIGRYQLNQNLEFVSFFDAGAVMDNHAFTGVNPQSGRVQKHGYLMSTGFGLRARLTQHLNARLDVGFPLIWQDPDKNVARLHFGVESRLF